MSFLIRNSLTEGSYSSYKAIWDNFSKFLLYNGYLIDEESIAFYIAHLYNEGKKHNTISSHLSALSFCLRSMGFPDLCTSFRIKRMIMGVTKLTSGPDLRSAIDFDLLMVLIDLLPNACASHEELIMFRAVFTLAYSACLRVSEYAVSSTSKHTLKLSDVAACLSKGKLDTFRICLTSYKFSKGPKSFTLPTYEGDPRCPVQALRLFMGVRGFAPGFLFMLNLKPLRDYQVNKVLAKIASFVHFPSDKVKLSSHGFRIGRCTDWGAQGLSEAAICDKGRWASAKAFRHYLRPASTAL